MTKAVRKIHMESSEKGRKAIRLTCDLRWEFRRKGRLHDRDSPWRVSGWGHILGTPILGSTKGHKPFGWRGDGTNPTVVGSLDPPMKITQGRECGLRMQFADWFPTTTPGCTPTWAQWTMLHFQAGTRVSMTEERLQQWDTEGPQTWSSVWAERAKPLLVLTWMVHQRQSKSHCGQTTTAHAPELAECPHWPLLLQHWSKGASAGKEEQLTFEGS